MTHTVEPTSTLAVRTAAPNPVVMPHPMRQALSRGMSSITFTIPFWWTSISSAKPPSLAI